jgi:predicted metal-dependent phosphoesterase TrpH
MIDLHSHTTCSDGSLSPSQLVEEGIAAGLKALAITDHDTLAGWDEATETACDRIEIIPGLELSTVHNGRSLHILGFYPQRDQLTPPLAKRIAGRHRRAQQIVEKLAALGMTIDLPPMPGTMAPGRPHIASALVNAGYAQNSREAFDRWLGDDGPAYVEYDKFPVADGIRLLRDCGAVAVWAHPTLFRGGTVATVLPELVQAGLQGLEVYHPSHSPSEQRQLQELAQTYGLLETGGSDYHGPAKHSGDRTTQLNQLQVPLNLLAPLKAKAGA